MNKFILAGGKIVTGKKIISTNIYVEGEKIVALKKTLPTGKKYKIINIKGKYVLPGLIDAHVHFRTPGLTHKEDWATGSRAALAGGVTTVLDMPNVNPLTIDEKSLREKKAIINKTSLVDYGLFIGVTNDNIDSIMKVKGVVGYKLFMGSSTGNMLMNDKKKLNELFKKSNKIIAVHAESEADIQANMKKFSGTLSVSDHSKIRSAECAIKATGEILKIARQHNKKLHICHMSTAGEVRLLKKLKNKKITAEVAPHHLFLSEKDYDTYGNWVKVNPPIRTEKDQEALWKGLKSGIIDSIGTDHAPHTIEEKNQTYEKAPSGIPGVQTMLPLLLDAVNNEKITLTDLVRATSERPANIFNLKKKGKIKVGFDADLVVIDLKKEHQIKEKSLFSKCGWAPYVGWKLRGLPLQTYLRGHLKFSLGKITNLTPGQDQYK